MANKAGWWNANEQVSQAQAWTPVHKLGDYSVARGGGGGLFGDIARAVGTVALAKYGKGKGGAAAAKAAPKALPTATAVMPTTPSARNASFTSGAQGAQAAGNAWGPPKVHNLTDVRSSSSYGQDVAPWAGGRYAGMDPGLSSGVTPARLQPFQAGIGAAEPVTAELVSTPLRGLNPAEHQLYSGDAWYQSRYGTGGTPKEPLALNAGPQPEPAKKKTRPKPGLGDYGRARFHSSLSEVGY